MPQQRSAFITAKKGFCYLTVKIGRQNFPLMRIRNYTLDAQDKRDMRRLHPDTIFDWKKIDRQLAEKREVCRSYRSRRRIPKTRVASPRPGFLGVYDPFTRTVYTDDIADALPLLDAVLEIDRRLNPAPCPFPAPEPPPTRPRLKLKPVK
jgi:hypothetical protein